MRDGQPEGRIYLRRAACDRTLTKSGSKEDCEYPPDNSKIPGKEKQ